MENQEEKNGGVREDAKISGITIFRGPFDSFLSYFYDLPYVLTSILGDRQKVAVNSLVSWLGAKTHILFYLIPPLPQRGAHTERSLSERANERTAMIPPFIKYPTCHIHYSFSFFLILFLRRGVSMFSYGRKGYLDSHLSIVVSVLLKDRRDGNAME